MSGRARRQRITRRRSLMALALATVTTTLGSSSQLPLSAARGNGRSSHMECSRVMSQSTQGWYGRAPIAQHVC